MYAGLRDFWRNNQWYFLVEPYDADAVLHWGQCTKETAMQFRVKGTEEQNKRVQSGGE